MIEKGVWLVQGIHAKEIPSLYFNEGRARNKDSMV